MTETPFAFPEITDSDIRRAAMLLGLRADAFGEGTEHAHRVDVLRSRDSIDVVACPGSGKTTLLVAKLAILAEKWTDQTRGICVLSHTNVARKEVETRLGNSSSGRRLLSYPHYIGTIHGFVNEFLALPWLRSLGKPVRRIDTDYCLDRRWRELDRKTQHVLLGRNKGPEDLRVTTIDCDVEVGWGKGTLGPHSGSYQSIQKACRAVQQEGVYCYEDMFLWANDLMDKNAECVGPIRDRFPLLFIDEAQDNSEEQSAMLARVFGKGDGLTIRQRFGDNNQAIFDRIAEKEEVKTDPFPRPVSVKEVPDSYRFGGRIAQLAAPLGAAPQPLRGRGPKEPLASGAPECDHTIFVFGRGEHGSVLDAYANLLIETFTDEELRRGTFLAVGMRHKAPASAKPDKEPEHVGHYWPEYRPEAALREPRPTTMRQHVLMGIARASESGASHAGINMVTAGIARLVTFANVAKEPLRPARTHEQVIRGLEGAKNVRRLYQYVLCRWIVRGREPSRKMWERVWSAVLRAVASVLTGRKPEGKEFSDFLTWGSGSPDTVLTVQNRTAGDNNFQYPSENPKVTVRLGSIHSVKGETHTAILLLETFWHAHNLGRLLQWLDGRRAGTGKSGQYDLTRLKIHYVGMTRPTHLVCLAMRRDSLQKPNGEMDGELIARLKAQGWKVKMIHRLPGDVARGI